MHLFSSSATALLRMQSETITTWSFRKAFSKTFLNIDKGFVYYSIAESSGDRFPLYCAFSVISAEKGPIIIHPLSEKSLTKTPASELLGARRSVMAFSECWLRSTNEKLRFEIFNSEAGNARESLSAILTLQLSLHGCVIIITFFWSKILIFYDEKLRK